MENMITLYQETRACFPEIINKADKLHITEWGELNHDDIYSWLGSLAKVINKEMQNKTNTEYIGNLFTPINKFYLFGNAEVKNCIDVSFIENLFWQVSPKKSEAYWLILPTPLQELYFMFHMKRPF